MDAAALRLAFADFLGEERFRKFVRQGLRRGRLRFWQEEAWSLFITAHPEFAVSLDELRVALRVCEVHGRELLPGTAKVFHGCRDYADHYIKARNELFPHAMSGPVSTEGAAFTGDSVEVWYCPECRDAEVAWRAGRCP